jgi:hypothetical protein
LQIHFVVAVIPSAQYLTRNPEVGRIRFAYPNGRSRSKVPGKGAGFLVFSMGVKGNSINIASRYDDGLWLYVTEAELGC